MDKRMRGVVGAASFGTILEWYDFFLYGTAAALVFPHLFFPESDPVVGTLLSFGAYATGFLARPLGGLISGHFGDRVGRRKALIVTLLVMGLSTAAIGLLPSYDHIGVAAPILLVCLRITQGLATGGEWGGASLLTLEHATHRRAFFGAFISAAVYVGLILGTLIFLVLDQLLTDPQLLAWGWRIPFLLSLLMVGVGIYIRRNVDESPEFEELKDRGERSRAPIVEAVKAHPRNILAIFFMRVGQNTSFYIVAVFCLAYATNTLGMQKSVTLTALMAGSVGAAIAAPLWGALADRIGYNKIMVGSLVASAALAFPLFWALDTKSAGLIIVVVFVLIAGVNAANDAIQPGYFTSLFGTGVRYSGTSIGREGGSVVGGGLSPLIATWLLAQTGHWYAVAVWIVVTSLVGAVAVKLVKPLADENDPASVAPVSSQRADAVS